MESLVTEVRSFYSLRELGESVDDCVSQYNATMDDYSQWLGSFLRDSEETHRDEEWFKTFARLQKSPKSSRKGKKSASLSEWIAIKGVLLGAQKSGEAEILFDAIEDIKNKIGQLENVKDFVGILKRSGLGKDTVYIVYIHNGVPEKIVVRHRKDEKIEEKFKFIVDLSASKNL
ncbi:MAG: hypothetical protein JSV85_00860 [Candidatus Bathyarchaeota archaeon]|nr:MAG: hypothetical protein JSV85_00860 [Candidatus Bathyarchaeota archaeon]